jgi:uncharacterized protein YydD (DUF2326 family)
MITANNFKATTNHHHQLESLVDNVTGNIESEQKKKN